MAAPRRQIPGSGFQSVARRAGQPTRSPRGLEPSINACTDPGLPDAARAPHRFRCPGDIDGDGDTDLGDPAKAGWNWNLINSDGGKGVHNPGFALGVLAASAGALSD